MQCRLCIARKTLLNNDMLVQGRLCMCNCIAGYSLNSLNCSCCTCCAAIIAEIALLVSCSIFLLIANSLQHTIQTPSHTMMRHITTHPVDFYYMWSNFTLDFFLCKWTSKYFPSIPPNVSSSSRYPDVAFSQCIWGICLNHSGSYTSTHQERKNIRTVILLL